MIDYILKSSLSLLLMFGLYWFLLRTEKLFVFNRFFLILALIISLILPFISIPVNFHPSGGLEEVVTAINGNIQTLSPPQVTLDQDQNISQDMLPHQLSDEIQPPSFNYSNIFLILYFCGMLVFFLRFINNVYLLLRQVRSNEKIPCTGSRIVLVRERINPYCFFNTIFLSREDYESGKIDKALINHEMKHISQYHSVDIVILELIRIIYWFNPILILYSSSIRENHEYLADRGAVIDDIKSYSEKLLKSAFGNVPITSGFNRSLTRKRLMMITSPESGSIRLGLKISLTSSLLALFFLLLSFKQAERQSAEMIFVPYEEYDTTKFMEDGKVRDIVTYSEGFYMSNEITNKEYREFTDWVKNNPDEFIFQRKDISKTVKDPKTGRMREIIFHVPARINNTIILPYLIDSSALYKSDKKYKNYFTDPKYDDFPVVGVSRKLAEYYCNWRSISEAIIVDDTTKSYSIMGTSHNYRLPTEKEWKFAAQSPGGQRPIDKIHEITREGHGILTCLEDNVSEWIADMDDKNGIAMGGSWKTGAGITRRNMDPDSREGYIGFRIVRNSKKRLPSGTDDNSRPKIAESSSKTPSANVKTIQQQTTAKDTSGMIIKIQEVKSVEPQEIDTLWDPSKALFVIDGIPVEKSEHKRRMMELGMNKEIVRMGSLRGKSAIDKYGEDARHGVMYIITKDYFKVKGIVLREDGIPLPKVFVNVSTELVRSITNKEGRFEIKDVPENSLLVFASPGYTPKIVKSEFETEMMVIMAKEPDIRTVNKPGIILSSSKSKPLIIVDGVIKTDSELPNANFIKSVTVLKNQAAVSVYGDKGANGVIIVVTRDSVEKKKGLSQERTIRGYMPLKLPHPVDLPLPEFPE